VVPERTIVKRLVRLLAERLSTKERPVEKVPCTECGAMILPRTAAKNGGLCAPCERGDRTTCRLCGCPALKTMRGVDTESLCRKCREQEERNRLTEITSFVEKKGQGDCSLLVSLYLLDERRRREGRTAGFGLYLIDPPAPYDSYVTPTNSLSFAGTGSECVHFSLLTSDGKISDASRVIVTVPEAGGDPWNTNFVVGNNLHEFLCLGCQWGFGVLEYLPFDWAFAIDGLTNGSDSFELYDEEIAELKRYRQALNLEPWSDVGRRLKDLQSDKRTVLRF